MMTHRSFVPSVFLLFFSLASLPSAQAGYLNVTFQGSVTSAFNDAGDLFDFDAGETVTGSIQIDLAFAERYSTDYEIGGDAYYFAGESFGPQRYITSQISIGDRNFILGPSTTSTYDEESVWMFRADSHLEDIEGPRDYLAIQDEYYYDNGEDLGTSGFTLDVSMIDELDSFLSSLNLDQEFSWVDDSDLPGTSGGGRLMAEADVGIGGVSFKLNAVQASLTPTEVPEPASLGILLTGLLAAMGLRRRSARR